MGRSKLAIASLTLAALLAPQAARAQSAQDKAAAEAAFEEGKRLMTARAFSDACPKFAESLRRDPGLGTMLGLADCYEKNGQTASAWAEFHEAAALAARKTDRREALARDNAARLEPLLAKIQVRVPRETDVQGLVVKRDGVDLGRASWDGAIPVDPGVHAVSATAPGFKDWQISVDVPSAPGTQTITVPRLEPAPEAPPPQPGAAVTPGATPLPPGPPPDPNKGNTQRIVGVAAAGVGVIGVVVGSVLGLVAKSKLDQSNANDNCDSAGCNDTGISLRNSALGAATGSTIGFIAGGVLIAGGAVLWFTAPRSSAAQPDAAPTQARLGLAPTPNGVMLVGRW